MRTKIRRKQTRSGVRWYVSTMNGDATEDAHGGYRTRTEARNAAAALISDSSRGRYVKPSELTVRGYLLEEWLPSRENADVSPNTRDTDRTVVEA
jgi:hypothetical protein